MRALALEEEVECHGVHLLLDRLQEHRILGQDALTEGLRQITDHPRCRPPKQKSAPGFATIPACEAAELRPLAQYSSPKLVRPFSIPFGRPSAMAASSALRCYSPILHYHSFLEIATSRQFRHTARKGTPPMP